MDLTDYGFEVVGRSPSVEPFKLDTDNFDEVVGPLILQCAKKLWPKVRWSLDENNVVQAVDDEDVIEAKLLPSPQFHKSGTRVEWISILAQFAYIPVGDLGVGSSNAQASMRGQSLQHLAHMIYTIMHQLHGFVAMKIDASLPRIRKAVDRDFDVRVLSGIRFLEDFK